MFHNQPITAPPPEELTGEAADMVSNCSKATPTGRKVHIPRGAMLKMFNCIFYVESVSRQQITTRAVNIPPELKQGQALEIFGGRFHIFKIALPDYSKPIKGKVGHMYRVVIHPAKGTKIDPRNPYAK